jgi:hypothetical protein
VDIYWQQLAQPSWQADPSAPFDPAQVMGLAFLFAAGDDERSSGTLWVDDISYLAGQAPEPLAPTAAPTGQEETPTPTAPGSQAPPPTPTKPVESPSERGLCGGAIGLGLITLLGGVWVRSRGEQ